MELFSSFPEELAEIYPLDKFLDFFDARQDLDMSASNVEMASSLTPSSRMRKTKTELLLTGESQDL